MTRITIVADDNGQLQVNVETPGQHVHYPDVLFLLEMARDRIKEKASGGDMSRLLLANMLAPKGGG